MSLLLRKHIEEIVPLTDEEFEYVLSHFIPVKRKKHQFIVEPGDEVTTNYWVVNGCLKAYLIENASDKEHIIQFAMENWWITDYLAYGYRKKADFFITCLEDCELLSITFENQYKLCGEMHKMEHFWHMKVSGGYLSMQRRILSLLKSSAQERYEQLLEQYPQLFQRVPKKMIAAYLGVSRETLSRFHSSEM